jgi:hypothetical protein
MSITTLTVANRESITIGSESISVVTIGTQGPQGIAAAEQIFIAAEAMNATLPAAVDSTTGKAKIASNLVLSDINNVLGVTTGAAAEGEQVTVKQAGTVNNNSWTWVSGAIYLGDRVLTQTPPAAGFIQIVATATSATSILINVQLPIAR